MIQLSKLFTALFALIILTFVASTTVFTLPQSQVITTLAIDVGSSATRLSVVDGVNGPAFGDTGEPTILLTGPGTCSSPGPLESNWTADGYLLIKDGTDEANYVHPSNTLFNLYHPIALRSKHDYRNRPSITGFQAFTLIDLTGKYLEELITSSEMILGQNITSTAILLPHGHNVRTTTSKTINDTLLGNNIHYGRVHVGGHDPRRTERKVMNMALGALRPNIYSELYRRTSAAMFPFENGMEYSRAVLVYRLGGSTLEVSVSKVDGGTFDTMSSVYDQHLGGNDFNQRVMEHLLLEHTIKTGQDLSGDDIFLSRLGHEVENAKRVLSVQNRVWIEVKSSHPGGQGLTEMLTRTQFEDLNMDLFKKTIAAIDRAVKDSVLYTKDDVQDVVFSGGSANIPFLQSAIREYFGPQKKYHGSSHPETTIVLGAAKLGHWHQDSRHSDIGMICSPSELTAALGIEIAGGMMFRYTDRKYTTINKMYTFSTTRDYQDRIVIRVFHGVGKWTNQNRFLGGIELTGIAPGPKGVPQIRVRLSTYGSGGYINLNVMDVATRRINATIFSLSKRVNDYYGLKFEHELMEERAFELEPAGKLTLLHTL